jgi:2-phospho-L-lactate transferase/gluconeogenesis factor (CofD/UPF0052 family)
MHRKKRIVSGGGTGTYTVLSYQKYADSVISLVVAMTDSGDRQVISG